MIQKYSTIKKQFKKRKKCVIFLNNPFFKARKIANLENIIVLLLFFWKFFFDDEIKISSVLFSVKMIFLIETPLYPLSFFLF